MRLQVRLNGGLTRTDDYNKLLLCANENKEKSEINYDQTKNGSSVSNGSR